MPSFHIDCKQLTDLCVRWDIHFAELGVARDLGGLRNSNTHPPILQLPTPDSRHHESPPPPTHPHPVSFLLHNHHFKTPLNHALHSFRLPCLSTLSSTSTSLPTLMFLNSKLSSTSTSLPTLMFHNSFLCCNIILSRPPDNPVVDPDPLDKFLVLQSREERNVDVGHNDLDDEKGRTLGNRFIVSSKILEGPPHTFSAPL